MIVWHIAPASLALDIPEASNVTIIAFAVYAVNNQSKISAIRSLGKSSLTKTDQTVRKRTPNITNTQYMGPM
jgi:hypothetical protein